jgi:hypothetical protein
MRCRKKLHDALSVRIMADVPGRASFGRVSVQRRPALPVLTAYAALAVLLVSGSGSLPAQAPPPSAVPPPAPAVAAPVPAPGPAGQPSGFRPFGKQAFARPGQPAQPVATTTFFVPAPVRFQFQFKIDPKTPLKDLLPVPPRAEEKAAGPLVEDLTQVPEVMFQEPLARDLANQKAKEQTALAIARINHLNKQKNDHFMEALRENRPDLAGLPLAMGEACRTTGERSREFALAVAMVRRCLQQGAPVPSAVSTAFFNEMVVTGGKGKVRVEQLKALKAEERRQHLMVASVPPPAAAGRVHDAATSFWKRFREECASEEREAAQCDRAHEDLVIVTRIAALMQVLAPETPSMRQGLVKYLAGVAHVEATRALARLAIFSAEDEVRQAALDALKVRRERDYTAILVQGLRYPLPVVARRASEAMVKLERSDLIPQLVDLLDEADPRAPVIQEVNQKRVSVVREVVRINHHRNCLLCHAPGNTGTVSPEALTAAVPVPSEPLPTPSQGYDTTSPDLLVRIDVTYLRQDFSMRLPVADANPWPEMQRFDFLVRTRVLTAQAAKVREEALARREPGVLSPYHRAALAALRELTTKDTEPTAPAWRRLLGLPVPERRLETVRN